jgi:hypothetical protein
MVANNIPKVTQITAQNLIAREKTLRIRHSNCGATAGYLTTR